MGAVCTAYKFSKREQKFITAYFLEATPTQAVRAAGFKSKTPHTYAWHLLQKPKIQIAIRQEQELLADEYQLTPGKLIRMLLESYQRASDEGNVKAMIEACKTIGRIAGLYPDQKH